MSISDEDIEKVENEFPNLFDQAEEIVEVEKQLTELSVKWANLILNLKSDLNEEEFKRLQGTRQMLVDLDEEFQNNKEKLSKLKVELEALKNASKSRS